MTGKSVKELRRRLMEKYTGEALTGYEHLDDGTGDFARNVPEDSENSFVVRKASRSAWKKKIRKKT